MILSKQDLHEISIVDDTAAAYARGYDLKFRKIFAGVGIEVALSDEDLKITGLGALGFGEIYVRDNTNTMTLNSAAKVQITDFDTNGEALNMTPEHANDHIIVSVAGTYWVMVSIVVRNAAGSGHEIHVELFKNNGATVVNNVHAHHDLSASTDAESISLNGIITAAADDTLELWADTDIAGNRNVIFEDLTFSVMRIK